MNTFAMVILEQEYEAGAKASYKSLKRHLAKNKVRTCALMMKGENSRTCEVIRSSEQSELTLVTAGGRFRVASI